MHEPIVANGPAKAFIAWAAFGITEWADIAAFLAAVYSFLLIVEWVVKFVKKRRAKNINAKTDDTSK